MNLKKIVIIYQKELLDVFRDKRTVLISIILPIIIYPLFIIGFSSVMSRQESKVSDKGAVVFVVDSLHNEFSQILKDSLLSIPNFTFQFENEKYLEEFEENKINGILEISRSINETDFNLYKLKIIFDASKDEGQLVLLKLEKKLKDLETYLVKQRLKDVKISLEILKVIDIEEENVASKEKMFGMIIGKILPYLLMMLIISGGAVAASDLVAGEKERNTLETLLVSAAHRTEIVIGKYLTIITLSFITILLNLLSLYFSLQQMFSQASNQMSSELQIPLANFALVFVAMIPLITLFSAILLSISTFSRNMKEANTYLSPLMMVGMMCGAISVFPGIKMNIGLSLIPIVNFSLLFKNIMLSDFRWLHFGLTVGSTFILDAIAIFISIKLFNKESILFREESSLKFWGKKSSTNIFSVNFIMIFFVILIIVSYFLGGKWQSNNIIQGLQKSQIFLFLLPVLLLLKISKQNMKKVLRLNFPKLPNVLLSILLVLPAFIISSVIISLINKVFPIPEAYAQFFEGLLSSENISFKNAVFTIAVLPAVCEEMVFRGYIINGFKKYGFWAAIIISGILFGIIHLDIYRLLPTAILGIFLGYILLKTNSIFPAMIFHFLNNLIAILISREIIPTEILNLISNGEDIKMWLIAPAIISVVFVYWGFEKINKSKDTSILIPEN